MFNQQTSTESERTIPMDLFPTRDKHLDEIWAKKTFKFCHLFCESINHTSYDLNKDHISIWLKTAAEILKKLKLYGIVEGEKHVVDICKSEFKLRMRYGTIDIDPASISDILTIYSDKWYYKENRDKILQQIYVLTYGLLRNGSNHWALSSEKKFMKEYNIVYKTETIDENNKWRSRGCLYQILVSRFSNTNTRRFKIMMKRQHGESLCVRGKKDNSNNALKKETIKCSTGHANVIRETNYNDLSGNIANNSSTIQEGKSWVEQCLAEGYTEPYINGKIREWFNEYANKNHKNDLNGGMYID